MSGGELGARSQRLFVALDLPRPAVGTLVDWQAAVVAARASLRVVGRDALHATLCFLGDVAAERVPDAVAALDGIAGSPAGGLALGQAVWLPRRRPRVLAVALEDDRSELRDLQALLSARLVRAGLYEPEARLFFPHVTVARVRDGERVRPVALPAPAPVEFAAEFVTLYRSHLGDGPARYEAVHPVRLTGA